MRKAAIESDGTDVFVVYNGVRIAKRGQPGTPLRMRVTRSGPWNVHCPLPGNDTLMRWRTLREHPFRTRPDLTFRMNQPPTTQSLPS
jgi:hypothetical protein